MDNREGLHQYKNLKSIYEPYANLFIIQLSKGIIILNDVPGTNPKPKSQPPKTLNLRDQSKLITKENQIFGLWRLIPINKQDIPNFPQEINQSMKSSYLKDRLRKKKQHVPSSSSIEIDQIVVSIANLFGSGLAMSLFVCLFIEAKTYFTSWKRFGVVYTRRRSHSVLVQDVFLFGWTDHIQLKPYCKSILKFRLKPIPLKDDHPKNLITKGYCTIHYYSLIQ